MTLGIGNQPVANHYGNPGIYHGGLPTQELGGTQKRRVYGPGELTHPSDEFATSLNSALERFSHEQLLAEPAASTISNTAQPVMSQAITRQSLPQAERSNALNEIHSIASQAGFVGLTDSDIQRAYQQGASLLVDRHA